MSTHGDLYFGFGTVIDENDYERMMTLIRQRNPDPYKLIEDGVAQEEREGNTMALEELPRFLDEQLESDIYDIFRDGLQASPLFPRLIGRNPGFLLLKSGSSGAGSAVKITLAQLEEWTDDADLRVAVDLAVEWLGLERSDFDWYLYEDY